MGWDDLIKNPLPAGGVLLAVAWLIRIMWGFEHDFVRKYSERMVELEGRAEKAEKERDEWRERYFALMAQRSRRQQDG